MNSPSIFVYFHASAGIDVPRPLRPPEESPRVLVRFILIVGRDGCKTEELAKTLPKRRAIIVI